MELLTELSGLPETMDAIVRQYMERSRWFDYSEQRLTRRGAQIYVGQHGIFTRASRQHWAFVVGNCPEVAIRRFIVRENLYEEEGSDGTSHFIKLVQMGEAVGMDPRDIYEMKPLPTTRAALEIWETLTKGRPWWVGLAAKAALERSNAPQCGNMSAAEGSRWMRQLGLRRDQVEFWLMHDEIDQVHGSGAYSLLLEHLREQRQVQDVLDAVEDSMLAWCLWLDGIQAEVERG